MDVRYSFSDSTSTKKMKVTGQYLRNYINTLQYHGYRFQLQEPRKSRQASLRKKK